MSTNTKLSFSPIATAATKEIIIIGVSHQTLNLASRERLGSVDEIYQLIFEQSVFDNNSGAVVLQTCNRTEVLISVDDNSSLVEIIKNYFKDKCSIPIESFADVIYCYKNDGAVRHLFEVCSGIDSMMLGEAQIFGQVKQAFEYATQKGGINKELEQLLQFASRVVKQVRNSTGIGIGSVSFGSTIRQLASDIFENLNQCKFLLIGTSSIGLKVLRHFMPYCRGNLYVASSSVARAGEVAEGFDGVGLSYENLNEFIGNADIIIGARNINPLLAPMVTVDDVRQMSLSSCSKIKLYVDLGVPRNFDERINSLNNVFLYNVDDLGKIVQNNLEFKKGDILQAKALVTSKVESYYAWREENHRSQIKLLTARSEMICEEEMEKTIKRFRNIGFDQQQLDVIKEGLQLMAKGIRAKILHGPISSIKNQDSENE